MIYLNPKRDCVNRSVFTPVDNSVWSDISNSSNSNDWLFVQVSTLKCCGASCEFLQCRHKLNLNFPKLNLT